MGAVFSANSYPKVKFLTAEILPTGGAEFECGFVLPRKEVQFLTPAYILGTGDKISFTISDVRVLQHTHEFQCSCGIKREAYKYG